jgi:hypothetical protein
MANSELMMQIKQPSEEIENDDRQNDGLIDECHKNNDADRHFAKLISLLFYSMIRSIQQTLKIS